MLVPMTRESRVHRNITVRVEKKIPFDGKGENIKGCKKSKMEKGKFR